MWLKQLTEKEFSTGTTVEVKKKVEPFGIIWAPAITIKENETGTLLVKYKGFGREGRKTNVSYSKIRPSPPPFGSRAFGLMENVDALLESGWCPSVVTMVLSWNRYAVLLGRNKPCEVFNHSQLRPSVEWSDGAWQTQEEKVKLFTVILLGEDALLVGLFIILILLYRQMRSLIT